MAATQGGDFNLEDDENGELWAEEDREGRSKGSGWRTEELERLKGRGKIKEPRKT